MMLEPIVPGSPFILKRFYVCFKACKQGFLDGCRHITRLDECFLKGRVKCELLSAMGRDANNQMYSMAWAMVEGENKDS